MIKKLITWLFLKLSGDKDISILVHTHLQERGRRSISYEDFADLQVRATKLDNALVELGKANSRIQELEEANLQLSRQKQNYVKDRVKRNG